MKDNAPAALMVFLIAIVLLIVLDDLRVPETQDDMPAMVHEEADNPAPLDLATTDEFE